MTKVSLSTRLDIPPENVWDLIGPFNALPDWHPAIEKSTIEKEGATTTRTLHLVGGGVVRERLDRLDEDGRSYTYTILESPLPVAKYSATLKVIDEGGKTRIDWSSEFEPAGVPENDAVKAIQNIYQTGFENLRKIFGG